MNRFVWQKRIFQGAGVYGILALAPQYFLENKIGLDFPPPITHPEHFYGFLGVALAWQVVFLIIARDVVRYRALMLPAVLEKVSFGAAAWALWAQGRVPAAIVFFGSVDLMLAALFAGAYRSLSAARAVPEAEPRP